MMPLTHMAEAHAAHASMCVCGPLCAYRWLALERILKGSIGISAALLADLNFMPDNPAELLSPPLPPPPPPPPGRISGVISTIPTSLDRAHILERLGSILFVSFSLIIVGVHIVCLRRMAPTCSVTFVTRARVILLYIAGFGQLVTLFMLLAPWAGWFMILITGWCMAIVGLFIYALYKIFFAPIPDNESSVVKRRRVKSAQMKILQAGAKGTATPTGRRGIGRVLRGSVEAARDRITSIIPLPSQAPPPPPPPPGGPPPPPPPQYY